MLNRTPGALARSLVLIAVLGAGCSRSVQVGSPTGSPPVQQIAINDGESLIRAMYQRYQDKWYRTLTFVQQTTILRGQTPQVNTWYEAMSLPGRLRIDIGNPDAHTGVLFRADSTYAFSGGSLTRADTGWNELLVLGFDVYRQPPEQTISILRHLGYQMSRFHTSSFDGRSTYVVGATSITDSTSKQFWIERDKLVFVRAREKRASGQQSDVWFRDYVKAGNGLVARQVWQFTGGILTLREDYSGVQADPVLDPALFDPKQFATVKHWTKP